MNGHADSVKTVASILDAAKKAAQRDQVCIRDVHGKRIVSVEARWMATLREESFRTWEFLVMMAKKVLQESSHNATLKDDKGDPVNLATIPSPGEYVWQLQGEAMVYDDHGINTVSNQCDPSYLTSHSDARARCCLCQNRSLDCCCYGDQG
jgi:hypothetical protein